MSVLNGENVSLRPIEKSDLESLNKWKNDEDVYRYLGGGFAPVSKDVQSEWLSSLMDMSGNCRRFIIEDLNSNALGMIGLYNINWIHRTCELGIFLGEEAARGKGLASEAYLLIEAYASRYLNLRKIKASVVSENTAAVNMYKKLSFNHAGTMAQERYINGAYCDLLLMEKIISPSS